MNNQNVGIDPVNPVNVNGFVEPNKKEDIGKMPPKQKPEKKPMNKILFIILILVLMAGVAFGVYYLLKISKNKQAKVTLKQNIVIPIGGEISKNIDDYAVIKGIDKNNCSLTTNDINSKKTGEYEFSINCNDDVYKGKVSIKDLEAPFVSLNVLYKETENKNNIEVKEFINSCEDESGCNYDFKDKTQLDNLTEGVNYIDIVVKDTYNNGTVEGVVYVVPYPINCFLVCSSEEEKINDGNISKTITDKLPMADTENGVTYLNAGRREYVYTFENEQDYIKAVGVKGAIISYDNVEGLAYYDDENKTLKISSDLSKKTLDSEAGGTFPSEYAQIKDFYINKGYTCSLD